MSDLKKDGGKIPKESISLESLLSDFLGETQTDKETTDIKQPRKSVAEDLSETQSFEFPSISIPEEDQKIKENVKQFEESVKKYFSENRASHVDEALNQIYDISQYDDESESYNSLYDESESDSSLYDESESDRTIMFDRASNIDTDIDEEDTIDEQDDTDNINDEQDDKPKDRMDDILQRAFSDEDDLAFCGPGTKDSSCGCGKIKTEYTSSSQDMEITRWLQNCTRISFKSVAAVLLLSLLCLYVELAPMLSLPHFFFLEPGKYSIVLSLVSLQILFFCVISCMDLLAIGIKNLFSGKPTAESAAFVVTFFISIQTIASMFLRFDSPNITLLCSVGCISILFLLIQDYFKSRALLMSFKIVSSKRPKFGTEKIDFDSPEGETFLKYLSDDSEIFTTKQKNFVNGFFSRSQQRTKSDSYIGILMIIGVAVGLILATVSFFIEKNSYSSFIIGTASVIMAIPSGIYLACSLPYYITSKKAFRIHSTLIGPSAGDYYSNASVLSFEDTAVFSPNIVKVTSIKTYGENRIDNVIITMAGVFEKLGGPLSHVFAKSVSNLLPEHQEVCLDEIAPDGLKLTVNGDEVLIGISSYMHYNGIQTPLDNVDESFIESSGSVLYLAKNNAPAAKFYIKYTMNPQFEDLLAELYNAGLCAGIKTIDPCINNELICANLKHTNYPVSVLKKRVAENTENEDNSFDTGVVSISGLSHFLKTFIMANTFRQTSRLNFIIKTAGIAIGFALLIFLTMTKNISAINVSLLVLFQLFWIIPISAISYIRK